MSKLRIKKKKNEIGLRLFPLRANKWDHLTFSFLLPKKKKKLFFKIIIIIIGERMRPLSYNSTFSTKKKKL